VANILAKTVEALDLLAANPRGLSVTELGQMMNTSKSTSSRLLADLIEAGMVQRDDSQRHFLDVRFWNWGIQAARRLAVLDIARPHVSAVVKNLGVSVFIAVARGNETIYLECTRMRDGAVGAELVSYVVPIYACAPGKAMLAFSTPDAIEAVLDGPLVHYTRHTHAERDDLAAELEKVRGQGYAVNLGEHQDTGTFAVAAPVFDQTALPVASVCFFGFPDLESAEQQVQALRYLAETVSASLGYSQLTHALVG
jgi:DNA-binding IclR family transcriptional regulator